MFIKLYKYVVKCVYVYFWCVFECFVFSFTVLWCFQYFVFAKMWGVYSLLFGCNIGIKQSPYMSI